MIDKQPKNLIIALFIPGLFISSAKVKALNYSGSPIWTPPPHIAAIGADSARLFGMGVLDVTLYDGWEGNPVDKTGRQDSYIALQKAIDDAHDYQLVAYFPAGVYMVSNTLKVIRKSVKARFHTNNITGSSKGDKTTIRLAANAPGFNNPANPKPVIWYWAVRGGKQMPFGTPAQAHSTKEADHQYSIGFLTSIQNITIDCNGRRGNTGAVGLRFPAAQVSGIHHVRILAEGAYAGCDGIPSRSSGGASNLEIVGGQYGILCPSGAGSPIASVTLMNQEVAAIKNENFVPVDLIGFHIIKRHGEGIKLFSGYNSAGGSMTLYDGIIEVNATAPAIDNRIGKNLYIRNVYVKGTRKLIQSPTGTVIADGRWKQIVEYCYNDQRTYGPIKLEDNDLPSFSVINGVIGKTGIATINSDVTEPPSNLVSRHGIEKLPLFEDDDAVILTEVSHALGDNETDNAEEIQTAIDTYQKIVIPKGRFRIGRTITLRADTILTGIDRNISRIYAHEDWKSTSEVPIITTDSDRKARTFLGPLTIGYPVGDLPHDWFTALDWRAGRNSVVFAVTSRFGDYRSGNSDKTQPHARYRISGSGGGRWYFWGMDEHVAVEHPDYRHLRIDSTTEPLWMYGCNLEKGKGDTRAEINNSKNIRIFNIKVETGRPVMVLNNCNNIGVFSSGALRKQPSPGRGHFEFRGSSNQIVMANINPQKYGQEGTGYTVLEHTCYDTVSVDYPYMVSVIKRCDLDDASMQR